MTIDDFDQYLQTIGLTVDVIQGEDGNPYSVVRDYELPKGSLRGRRCDLAIQRGEAVPFVPPAAIHTRPQLVPMSTGEPLNTYGQRHRPGLAVLEPALRPSPHAQGSVGAHPHRVRGQPMADQLSDLVNFEISAAMTAQTDAVLAAHVHKEARQEDLAFAYWRPSIGRHRCTAVITELIMPRDGDRLLNGNVAFYPQYLLRVLAEVPEGSGIAFLHGHPNPGWQGMSDDDIVAERDRLAGQVAGRTGLPLLGLTRGTDGAWSGRIWLRNGPRSYVRKDARSVRVVGGVLSITFHPNEPVVGTSDSQVATLSVWGEAAQERLVRTRVGIVGLGSVGSLVAESLSRLGLRRLTYIDFDKLERRNLDRTLGATPEDVDAGMLKVDVAARTTRTSATAADLDLRIVPHSLLTAEGLTAALDCDVLFSCVDRPLPRHMLNTIAYSHLIPVIDGGIMAKVKPDGRPQHVAWRIHTVGPDHACMVCLGALRRSDVALDMAGKLGRSRLHRWTERGGQGRHLAKKRVSVQHERRRPRGPSIRRPGDRYGANRWRRSSNV